MYYKFEQKILITILALSSISTIPYLGSLKLKAPIYDIMSIIKKILLLD